MLSGLFFCPRHERAAGFVAFALQQIACNRHVAAWKELFLISARLSQRLIRHHLPLGFAVLAATALFFYGRQVGDLVSRLSFATAYPALGLIAAALLIGPFRYFAGRRLSVSLDLRRDVGIWAGIMGILHAGIGQCVHLRGRPWLYYIYDSSREKHAFPMRHDLFGLANYTGLIATILLIALLATSNDWALRKLGTPQWKQLQRASYVCFGLSAIHTFAYQEGVESQGWFFLGLAIAAVAITLVLQLLGWRLRTARQAPTSFKPVS